jgi:hypothetical protein
VIDLLLNSVALDVAGIVPVVALLYLAGTWPKPKRRKPRPRVVAGVRCWCKAFGGKNIDCYCVSFKDGA